MEKWTSLKRGIDEWEGKRSEFVEIWEQSRWKGDKVVGVERVKTSMKRGRNETEFEDKKDWKDRKIHQNELKRGCLRTVLKETKSAWKWKNERKRFEVDEIGKDPRGKGCQFIVIDIWITNEDENERKNEWEKEKKKEREARFSRPSKTPEGREERLLEWREIGEWLWRLVVM